MKHQDLTHKIIGCAMEVHKQLFASKYKLYLPSEEELQRELQKERDILEERLIE